MRDLFALVLLLSLLITAFILTVEAQSCKPSGKLRGKKLPKDQINRNNDSESYEEGKLYDVYKCSPKVTSHTKAVLTINSFEKGQDGGGPYECDGNYHSDDTPIVALSTGWYNKNKRRFKKINIHGKGKSVTATVVTSVIRQKGVIKIRTTSFRASKIGVNWISLGLMLDQQQHRDSYMVLMKKIITFVE